MLPALSRSSSGRAQNPMPEGAAIPNRMSRQAFVPRAQDIDANVAAAAANVTGGDGTDVSMAGVVRGGRAAAAGTGCAAAKANRESRTSSISVQQQEEEAPCARLDGVAVTHSLERGPLAAGEGVAESVGSDSVHLLQHMQELLHEGASAEALQQWVSSQLRRANDGGVRASREHLLAPALSSESSPCSPRTTDGCRGSPNSTNNHRHSTSSASVSGVSAKAGRLYSSATTTTTGSGGRLMKASRTHAPGQQQHQAPQLQQQPQQPWRSFHRGGAASAETPTYNVANFAQTSSGVSLRRAQETSLHEVTKAAVHATTSRLVANEQRNIGLLLGELFSRNPESMVRRLATPPAAVTTTLAASAVATTTMATPLPVAEGRSRSNFSVDECSLPPAAYDRAEMSGTSPQASSSVMTRGVSSVPLNVDSDVAPADGPGLLPSHSPLYAAEDGTGGQRQSAGPFFKGGSTAIPTSSERSTPDDPSTAPTSKAASPQLTTLPNSVAGTAGTLTCEQDALFPPYSPLVSPAVSPVAGASTAGKLPGVRADAPHHVIHSPPSAVVTAAAASFTSDTPLPMATTADDVLSPVAGAAKRNTLTNVVSLIDVVFAGDESYSGGTAADSDNASANKGGSGGGHNLIMLINNTSGPQAGGVTDGQGGKGAPSAWGATVATDDVTDANGVGRGGDGAMSAVAMLPPVTSPATSITGMQSSSSAAAGNVSDSSPLTASGGPTIVTRHMNHHRLTQPYGRVASLVSNMSNHLVGGNNGGSNTAAAGAVGSYTTLPERRSSVSLGDDIQSFDSSRVSCVSGLSGGRDGALTGAGGHRPRRCSVLHLSHASVNGGIDPLMEGVMPDFVLDGASEEGRRPGPRFMRTYCRHCPVRVAESATRKALAELGVPYLPDIDEAANPMSVLFRMATYQYTDSRSFYVVMCLNVMLRYNFVRRFAWDTQKLKKFLEVAATFFRDGNPFHHLVHATEMVLGAHQWLCEGTTAAALSDVEVAAFLLAAMTLMLAHTGIDNRLLTQLKHPYAMLCSFASPQQGAVVALVMALLRYPELHFFPDPSSASVNVQSQSFDPSTDTAPANVAHEWTASREMELYDMFSELVMATDLRNHTLIQKGIFHMAEENAQRHGCLCDGAAQSRLLSPARAAKPSRGRGGTPLGITPNRPQRGDFNGSLSSRFNASSSSPLQQDGGSPSNSGNHYLTNRVCLNCCAYVTENHVPDLLKGVLHYLGFAFLFRTFETYVSGSLMYVAEMYRQSEVEYKLFQKQQQHQQQPRQAAGDLQAGSVGSGSQRDSTSVHAFLKSTAQDTSQHDTDLGDSTETFATAVMEEKPPWRQDLTHASTVASLQRRRSDELGSALLSRRPTTTTFEPPAFSTPTAAVSAQREVSAGRPASCSDDATSTETAVPSRRPRVRPLRGSGRDIFLIAVEDLSLPFVELFAPYLPASWVRATYLNHQTFTMAMPSPEEYDAAVNRVLDLAEESEEEIARRQTGEGAGGNDILSTVPWLLMRRTCLSVPDWTMNKDGMLRRVIKEIVMGTESLLEHCEM
ncbi:hypothetical protein ABB37_07970 [Leptomonas pyrrhocoris]|uniref:PDEase domain-containing protein n=1 Tax=Leptomonas pyrrhocoris TaxID=157538 RepID=A0A0M9FUE1_LEPPY|nr:hypothetical protein ABB37_07970 [Leptomonas pyrrhocoris]KPA76223.1 hypothetical protein ABB37_07970 [Leptomonas pyrrhocoris]|eukprot:XP_015654662.1 hypothetical protein ABB37_07970 [Leptomonas pyrrhocoris]